MLPQPASPSADAPRLSATGLACRRGSRLLFKGLAFEVSNGEIVWLRGRNGRGKTSLLRLATGLATPEEGSILRDGLPASQPGRRFVFIGHANALKDDLTVGESLQFLLRLHGRACGPQAVHAALEHMGLHGRRHAMVRTLSQGQRRRVALARLAVEDQDEAPLWLLDEPFDALDVDGVERLNDLLVAHVKRGGGVLLTSHLPLDTARLRPREVDLDGFA